MQPPYHNRHKWSDVSNNRGIVMAGKWCTVYSIEYGQGSVLICFTVVMLSIICWFMGCVYVYSSRLLHCYGGNHMIAPVPVKLHWRIWKTGSVLNHSKYGDGFDFFLAISRILWINLKYMIYKKLMSSDLKLINITHHCTKFNKHKIASDKENFKSAIQK